jgi:voltage-dependent potassium channel beta subunit
MEDKAKSMSYRFLGKTGMKVSVMSFGNWVNNTKPTEEEMNATYECMKVCIEHGVNYFDTAEIYGFGIAEEAMGKAFKKLGVKRKDIVVSTKFFRVGTGINDEMLSRKHLMEGIHASLKRLELDYVDVAFAHRYDPYTPIEEVCRAFDWMVNHNKAFYWATSMWTPEQIMEAMVCCEKYNLIKPIAEQAEYNILRRDNFESNLAPIFQKMGYGSTIWSPLGNGLLTGKYNDGNIPEGSRLAGKLDETTQKKVMEWYEGVHGDQLYPRLRALGEAAKEFGCTQAQLALAWCLVNKDVSTCITGASRPEQMVENLKALEVAKKWTPEIEKKIDDIVKNVPTPAFNWRDWKEEAPRRSLMVEKLA